MSLFTRFHTYFFMPTSVISGYWNNWTPTIPSFADFGLKYVNSLLLNITLPTSLKYHPTKLI